jgi:hypothetical protein
MTVDVEITSESARASAPSTTTTGAA